MGANGGVVSINEDFPNLQTCLYPDAMKRLSYAVRERYFSTETDKMLFMFEIVHLEKWNDFDTLTAAVIEERFRLDCVAAHGLAVRRADDLSHLTQNKELRR